MAQGILSYWRIRCVGCGKVLGPLEDEYTDVREKTGSFEEAAKAVGLTRPCCRMQAMAPVVLPAGTGEQYEFVDEFPTNVAGRHVNIQQPSVTGLRSGGAISVDSPHPPSMTNAQVAPGARVTPLIIAGKPVPAGLRPRTFYAR